MSFCIWMFMSQVPGCHGSSFFEAFNQHLAHRLGLIQHGPLVSHRKRQRDSQMRMTKSQKETTWQSNENDKVTERDNVTVKWEWQSHRKRQRDSQMRMTKSQKETTWQSNENDKVTERDNVTVKWEWQSHRKRQRDSQMRMTKNWIKKTSWDWFCYSWFVFNLSVCKL